MGFAAVFRYVGGRRDWFAAGLGMEGRRARSARAGDVATRDVPTCRPGERLDEVRDRVRAAGWDVCIVVNETRVVFGHLGATAWARGRVPVEGVMKTPTTYRPDTLVEALRERVRAGRPRDLVITDSDGRLVGVVRRRDLEQRPSGGHRPRNRRRRARARPARQG
jgi:CBS domain-containing protein